MKTFIIRSLFKKEYLDNQVLANRRLVLNLHFLGKVSEQAVADKYQKCLILLPLILFQPSFRPGFGKDLGLGLALMNYVCLQMDKGN